MGPFVQLLSNGRYRVVLTGAGAGSSSLGDLALTRWHADRTRDADGLFFYLRDLERGHLWSAGHQPVQRQPDSYSARSGPGHVRIRREDDRIVTQLDVCVDPEADAELRLLSLTNQGRSPRRLQVTSCVEVALNFPAADAAHPAFSKLFVQTDQWPASGALMARRRPRSPDETPVYLGHSLQMPGMETERSPEFETDRARFIGRGRTLAAPAELDAGVRLSGTTGNVLDPMFALRREVALAPGRSVRLVAILAAGRSPEGVADLLDQAAARRAHQRFAAAEARDRKLLSSCAVSREWCRRLPWLNGALTYGRPPVELGAELPSPSPLLPGDLRSIGLTGRLPLLVARIATQDDVAAATQLARVVTYWRKQGFGVDLLILNENRQTSALMDEATATSGHTLVRRREEIPGQVSDLVLHSARLVLDGAPVVPRRTAARSEAPVAGYRPASGTGPKPDPGEQLRFENGIGGFSADGHEYVIQMAQGSAGLVRPPLAWCNVVSNEEIGFLATESGAGYTWSVNSRENRLTPWSNDPVTDPPGEALYLRDDDSREFWSALPGPVPGAGSYEVRHGFGLTRYRHTSRELAQEVVVFVPRNDGVKLVRLSVTNLSTRPRRLSVTSYAEWVLGVLASDSSRQVHTERDSATGAILALNPHAAEFAPRVAFAALISGGSTAGEFTADRGAFLGEWGRPELPAALVSGAPLDGRAGRGLDPCAAFRTPLPLGPAERREVVLLLGQAENRDMARAAVRRYQSEAAVSGALEGVTGWWRETVGRVQVQTPAPALDLMVNGWLTYQNLACRMWGRSAFYQSGGAYGFRDQLQDAAALIHHDPGLTRQQILLHAAHQFAEGDVLHWWHPPLSKGIRTRFSDDLLWLPYVTAEYIRHSGDAAILDEVAPFLTGKQLAPGEDEAFLLPGNAGAAGDVYTHCCRAIDRSLTCGTHGLPLMGTGDWNDGMNRVGREGRGESVWLGFFLFEILECFLPFCEQRGDATRVERYRAYQAELALALNSGGWDGGWYRRAYYDNGVPLGAAESDECRIDAIAQAWAVISGAAPEGRATTALDALERYLVDESAGLIRLLTPAFDRTPNDPGYIKGYVPGVRENGGQYTHGALWAVRALAESGRRERAAHLLEMLSPVSHARTPAEVATYQVEPYVIAADVYGVAPHLGRGGWTWYTGSAGWMFRVVLESILGLTMAHGRELVLRPCIPAAWPGFSIRYRLPGGTTTYDIAVQQVEGPGAGTTRAQLDSQPIPVNDGAVRIPLAQDNRAHRVVVELRGDVGPRYAPSPRVTESPSTPPFERMTSA